MADSLGEEYIMDEVDKNNGTGGEINLDSKGQTAQGLMDVEKNPQISKYNKAAF